MTDRELDSMLDKLPEPVLPAESRLRFVQRFPERPSAWRGSWKWALAGVALTALTAGAFSQAESELSSATYPLGDGQVLVTRTLARPGAPAAWRWAARLKGDSGMKDGYLQQVLGDRWTGRYWGYRVTAKTEGGGYRFIFTSVNDARIEVPAVPAGESMKASGVVEFALSKDDGLYVRLNIAGRPPAMPVPERGFALTQPHVYLDGSDLGSAGVARLSGLSLELARAGEGRFVLVMDPQGDARFTAAGTVAGRRIEFHANGHTWRIESAEELPTTGTLYVWHDHAYQTRESLEFGAGGWTPGER